MVNDYGARHRAIRRALLPGAVGSPCARCGRVITAADAIDLDHDEFGGYLGWSHMACNRRAAAIKGNQLRRRSNRRIPMTAPCALGVEISLDRAHTSVVTATELPDNGGVLVELTYLDGSDTARAVADIARTAPGLVATALDPQSPSTTLLDGLKAEQIKVTEPTARDVALAHGLFLDELRAGRLRYVDHEALTAAVQHAVSRPLAGAQALDRRHSEVDASPLTAAELAVWALLRRPRATSLFIEIT